ncbi:HAD family hydrolase [Sporolactobacillus sp. KGMB 08714]|uniref:HAD family hydrolase n=1 Tax=Sporolactobacillus sp. KGMB 08714 TaxID=3064704 RepID=UPI002FBEB096
MINTLLFDVDGTLIDTEYVVIESLQKTLKEELGLTISDKELEFVLGIPGDAALERLINSTARQKQLLEKWNQNVIKLAGREKPFMGIRQLLSQLSKMDLKLGIVTSRTTQEMKDEIDRFGITPFFDSIITASDTTKHKPSPEPIQKALEVLNARPEEAIYIGDSIYDMQSAYGSQVLFALAKWGAKENNQLAKAKVILETPGSLIHFIEINSQN